MELICLPLIAITANLVTSFTGFLSYYLNNIVGFGVVMAGSFVTIFRIWDAVTDLGMGNIADKTNTKYGKFTPYMLVGGIGTMIVGQIMVNLPPMLPEGMVRKTVFVLLYLLFVIFTTMQVSGLRSTPQVCLKRGKERATYGMINGIYLTIFYTVVNMYVYSKLMPSTKGFNLAFFKTLITVYTIAGFICLLIYLFFYNKYDRETSAMETTQKTEKMTSSVWLSMSSGKSRTALSRHFLILTNGRSIQKQPENRILRPYAAFLRSVWHHGAWQF